MPNELVPSDVVKAIQDSAGVQVHDIDGQNYTSRPVHLPPQPRLQETIVVSTLEGLCGYVDNVQSVSFIHVDGHMEVYVYGDLDQYDRRAVLVEATTRGFLNEPFPFGRFIAVEEAIIKIASNFVDSSDKSKVLKLLGNLRSESVKTMTDDGLSQQVTVSAGVSRVGSEIVDPIVELAPYRTFPEIAQPISKFLIRFQQSGKDGLPMVSLFEADGSMWKLEAIQNIKKYLGENLTSEDVVILG